jgi:hypothetical protein
MNSTTTFDDTSTSQVDSALSEPPSTALLNRVEQELGLDEEVIDIDSVLAPTVPDEPRGPRVHKDIDGTVYIEILVKKDKGKSRTGWYWAYGTEFEIQDKPQSPRVWVCAKCKTFTSYRVHGSAHISKHLKSHGLYEKQPVSQRMSIAQQLQHHTPATVDNRLLAEADRRAVHSRKFEQALVAFICCVHIAFNIVENEFFVALLTTTSNLVPQVLPQSHNTVREWAVRSYHDRKLRVKNILQKARSRIHLSFDLWTSTNHHAFNAIVAHFVTSDYKVASILLAFRNLLGPHSGENIAASVQEVVQEYYIQASLGCFVLDNATSNDTAVQAIGEAYKWPRGEYKQRRLRCMGHIINLVAQAFLLGEKQEVFEQAVARAERDEQGGDEADELYKLCGPIGKLHYTVVFILRTPQRRQAFKRGDKEVEATYLVPKRDNSTRWNSIYTMIKRAIKLRSQINLFCSYTYKDDFKDKIRLNEDDWYILQHLVTALVYFESATMALQGQAKDGSFGAMGECIPIIEVLSRKLTELQDQFPLTTTFESTELDDLKDLPAFLESLPPRPGDDPATGFITECTNRAHAKLAQYYSLTDESTWFTAGMILDPTIKWRWCKNNWIDKPEWLEQAQENMRKLWRSTYKPTSLTTRKRHLPDRGQQPAKSIRREANFRDSSLYSWRQAESDEDEDEAQDEYEAYLQEKRLRLPEECQEASTVLFDYWKGREQRWPNLTRFAFDALSIPAMSAECERCFSSGKNMISDSRYSLAPDTIEACECNRHWILHKTAP